MDSLGLSLDGEEVLDRREVPGGFEGVTELRLDSSPPLAAARQFYLHITLAAGPGEVGRPSNVLSGIEVEARAAEPEVRTAAAPGTEPARP